MRITAASLALGVALSVPHTYGIWIPEGINEVPGEFHALVDEARVNILGGAVAAGPAVVNLAQEIPLEEWAQDKQDKVLVWEAIEPMMARPHGPMKGPCGNHKGKDHHHHHHKPSVSDRLRHAADSLRHWLGLPPVHKKHKEHKDHHHHHHGDHDREHHKRPKHHHELKEGELVHHSKEGEVIHFPTPAPMSWPFEYEIIEIYNEDRRPIRYEPLRPFMTRVHQALMTLGPWESRFVAFVFGCGIGALIRMFVVFFILAFRGARGRGCRRRAVFLEEDIVEPEVTSPPAYIADVKEPVSVQTAEKEISPQAEENVN